MTVMSHPFDPITAAISAIAAGGIVVVADDENRENEGDLIMAADAATPEAIAFFVRYTSGVICAALPGDQCDRLALPLMVPPDENADQFRTAFTITVDLADGTSTGISAADRAATLRSLAHPDSVPSMFNRPGHIVPLRARPNGVIERPGHTEAAVDLARLAGRRPAGVLSELVLDDGRMARLPELIIFAREHDLPLVSIADLIHHRRNHDLVGAHR
jgi:3,4-dihydroxy 2-butanone 4-phosphate synthase/GTP cyclohydrolase II